MPSEVCYTSAAVGGCCCGRLLPRLGDALLRLMRRMAVPGRGQAGAP